MVPNVNAQLQEFVQQGGSLTFLAELSEVSVSHLRRITHHNRTASIKTQNRIISALCELNQAKVSERAKIHQRPMSKQELHGMYLQRVMEKGVKLP